MYFGSRDFEEGIAYGHFVKERRNQAKMDFPFVLARRFEYLVFSIFVLDVERENIEISFTTDDHGKTWNAEPLLQQEIDNFLQFGKDACLPVYYPATLLHCTNAPPGCQPTKTTLETDRAVVLATGLGNNLRLFLTAHVPCGFSESLFQGIVACAEDIFGGFRSYAEELIYGHNRLELTMAQYWIQHIKSPALVFFGDGFILARNASADRTLQGESDLKVTNGRIVLPGRLADQLASQSTSTPRVPAPAQDGEAPQLQSIMRSASGLPFYVETVPSCHPQDHGQDPIRSYFRKKILIAGPSQPASADPQKIKATTDVTLQQARIIHKIISGKTLRQAAEEIGISYNTARNHLAMAQQRMGVSSQIELTNRVLAALYVTPDR
jgi:DNA-binding CsgD family transcriptional regulator/small basic protein